MLPAASYPIPPPDRNYLAFVPKGIASTTSYSQGFHASLSAQPTPLGDVNIPPPEGRAESLRKILELMYC